MFILIMFSKSEIFLGFNFDVINLVGGSYCNFKVWSYFYFPFPGFSSFNLSPNVRCMWFLRFKVIDLIASTAKLGSLLLM